MMINGAGFLERSRVNGPGERAVIWVQGCPLRCPGCFNRELWSFRKNYLVTAEEMAARILSIPGIEGVTFSGGEPFCQAVPLAALGRLVREEGLSVVTFSGYPARRLQHSTRSDWNALLQVTDILVAGPYDLTRRLPNSLCGSSNQEMVYLSGRIPRGPGPDAREGDVEFTISNEGEITMTGFPEGGLPSFGRGCT